MGRPRRHGRASPEGAGPPRAPLPRAAQIIKPNQALSLRLRGHLLLGLSKIFAKKVGFLYLDSLETLERLSSSSTQAKLVAQVDLAENEGPAVNINMAPIGGADLDLPELGAVDVYQ